MSHSARARSGHPVNFDVPVRGRGRPVSPVVSVLAAGLAVAVGMTGCARHTVSEEIVLLATRADEQLGPFPDPAKAALAAAEQAHAGLADAEADLLHLRDYGQAERVSVHAPDGFCRIYAPTRPRDEDGWYASGPGTGTGAGHAHQRRAQ